MSVRRDAKTGNWFFRTRVIFPDGRRDRIFGTPGVAGLYHDLPATKLGAMEAERRAITKAMTGQVVYSPKEVPTIRDYVEPFMIGHAASHKPSSRKDSRQRLNAYILPMVGDLRLYELRQEHVDSLVADMLDDEASRKQVNNTTSVLSSLIGYAVANKVIADPGLKFFIKGSSATVGPVASDDVDRLLEKAKDRRYRLAILLAADVGLRIGEIRALPWLEVNELARELTVAWSYDRSGNLTEPKSWERRAVPINERTWDAMRAVERKGPLVFARLDGKPLGYDATIQVAHELYETSGVTKPAKPWHSLRHTFGTELAARGTDLETIREMMGHKDISTTQRYLHTTRERKRAAVARLGSVRPVASKTSTK
jgi:integrase